MEQYIPKSALVAEIKARINDIEVVQKAGIIKKRDADMKITLFKSILSLLDTLEVKEVDLELTWEDVKEICTQSVLVEIDLGGLVSDERHYTEVLKRFKDFKERKEK